MIKYVASLFLLCSSVCAYFCAYPQGLPIEKDELKTEIRKFFTLYPQEKAELITDNAVYIPGETIWFKIYLWNNHQKISDHCEVVLLNAFGEIVDRRYILINDEQGHGDISLADTLPSALYSIELYTQWTKNFYKEPLASKIIWISRGESIASENTEMPLKPFIVPEGGHLQRNDYANKIAVHPGKLAPEGFTFELQDPDGKIIYSKGFETPFAIAEVPTMIEGAYSARVCLKNGSKCYDTLLTTGGPSVRVVSISPVEAVLDIAIKDTADDYLLVTVNDQSVIDVTDLQRHEKLVHINISNYPQGTIYFLLCSSKGIQSVRPVYHVSNEVPSVAVNQTGYLNDTKGSSVMDSVLITGIAAEEVCAFAIPENGFSGVYSYSQLKNLAQGLTLSDLMLFKTYSPTASINYFIEHKSVSIKHRSQNVQSPEEVHPRVSFEALALVASGLTTFPKVDSIIGYKINISRIRETYRFNQQLPFENIYSEKVYLPEDYPTISNLADLLTEAIPRLKTKKTSDGVAFHFFYDNLRNQKQLYSNPPKLVINGYAVNNFSLLGEIPIKDVASVEVVYNSKFLIDNGLQRFFPSGAVLVYLKKSATLASRISREYKVFSTPFSWPRKFMTPMHPETVTTDMRFPAFNSIYYWNGRLGVANKGSHLSFIRPSSKKLSARLFVFSLSDIKKGVYSQFVLE